MTPAPDWLMDAIGTDAITVWPWIFVRNGHDPSPELMAHERVHLEQQRRWAIYGLGAGLVLWFALYLLALPVWWNPWRRRWETEAMRAQGMKADEIETALQGRPYWLL